MVDLSIRVVDWESQVFRKNLKFKFLAIKPQVLRTFPPNAARILLTVIFNQFIKKFGHEVFGGQNQPFFVFSFFRKKCLP